MKKNKDSKKYRRKRAKRGFKRHVKAKERREKNKQSFGVTSSSRIYSQLIKFLNKNSNKVEVTESSSNSYDFSIPNNFSLIENPENTLEKLHELITVINDDKLKEIYIDHYNCKNLDIGASVVMDSLIMEAKKECRRKGVFLSLNGRYSTEQKVNEVIKIAGLIKHIKHRDSAVPPSIRKKYDVFDLVVGKKEEQTYSYASSKAETEATNFINYLNRLLRIKGVTLTGQGANYASNLVTEVLDNAEQHSGDDKWYLIGYLDEQNICNITIFNFGLTISNTLKNGKLSSHSRNRINELIKVHTSRGFLGIGNNWTEDDLWTLFALQEGVSRIDPKLEEDRGHGTVKMIEFFLSLSSQRKTVNKPKMIVLSGNTYILFDGTYHIKNEDIGGETRQIIAFNKENNLLNKPDSNYIKHLKYNFPGTVISMKFPLDQQYLTAIAKNENDQN